MAFTTAETAGGVYLTGVYAGQGAAARDVLLGPPNTTAQAGGVYLGVDALYETPVYVRSYFDPARHPPPPTPWADRYRRVGYVQFLQVCVAGRPVPPAVLGGDIGALQDYVDPDDKECWFVNFMSPGDARARNLAAEPPFFAYNGMLASQVNEVEAFGEFGAPSGSIWVPDPQPQRPRQMLGPSALAQINVPLITAGTIERACRNLAPLASATLTDGDRTKPLYQLCLEAVWRSEGVSPDDRRLTMNDVSRVRLAGDYLLMNVANSEHLEPVLCARLDDPNRPTRVTVYLLDYDQYRGMEELATLELVNRAVDWFESAGVSLGREPAAAAGRGTGGLYRPAVALRDGERLLRVNVVLGVYGQHVRPKRYTSFLPTLEPVAAAHVGINWKYDAETRILVYDGFDNPQVVSPWDAAYKTALKAWARVVGRADVQPPINPNYFNLIGTAWATPDPSQARPQRLGDWEDAD